MANNRNEIEKRLKETRGLVAEAEKEYIKFHSKRLSEILKFPGCSQVHQVRLTDDDEFISAVILADENGKYTHYYPVFTGEDVDIEDWPAFENIEEITDPDITEKLDSLWVSEIINLDHCFEQEHSIHNCTFDEIADL